MVKYVCFSSGITYTFDSNGEKLETNGDRALYYDSDIGKRRIYRQSYPLRPDIIDGIDYTKGLKLCMFDTPKQAQKLCNKINKEYCDDFEVKEISI